MIAEWRAFLLEHISAKGRTARSRGTYPAFLARWNPLLDCISPLTDT
jgi:hypothetical protein